MNPQDDDRTWSPWRDPFFLIWLVSLIGVAGATIAVRTWIVLISMD